MFAQGHVRKKGGFFWWKGLPFLFSTDAIGHVLLLCQVQGFNQNAGSDAEAVAFHVGLLSSLAVSAVPWVSVEVDEDPTEQFQKTNETFERFNDLATLSSQ